MLTSSSVDFIDCAVDFVFKGTSAYELASQQVVSAVVVSLTVGDGGDQFTLAPPVLLSCPVGSREAGSCGLVETQPRHSRAGVGVSSCSWLPWYLVLACGLGQASVCSRATVEAQPLHSCSVGVEVSLCS